MRRRVDAEAKEAFLELMRSGLKRNEAAEELGFSGSQFRALCNPRAAHFDADFADRFEEIQEEHKLNFEERVRSARVQRAMTGSDRLLSELALVTLPEDEIRRTSRFEVSGTVMVGRYFDLTQLDRGQIVSCPHCGHHLPEIDTLTQLVEKAQRKELPSGNGG